MSLHLTLTAIYLNLGPLVDKFFGAKSGDKAAIVSILDKICEDKLEPFIESSYQELARLRFGV